jgi:L-serine dehydratase
MHGFALNDIFKIGIGPSSSHTMGPMYAAQHFLSQLEARAEPGPFRVQVTLHGSLAATGDGHGTPGAITAGLMGYHYETVTLPDIEAAWTKSITSGHLLSLAGCSLEFNGEKNLLRDMTPLSGHPNGMTFEAWKNGVQLVRAQYFSVGGGMVEDHNRLSLATAYVAEGPTPFPYKSMEELVALCEQEQLSIAELQARNEHLCLRREEFDPMADKLWSVMSDCIDRGLAAQGELPGGLKVKRRAATLWQRLLNNGQGDKAPANAAQRAMVYAMAVNEENAAGGRLVTAPTNGAAGIVPAVLKAHLDEYTLNEAGINRHVSRFLRTATAIGGLFKMNASISGAEVGCQGEVGAAASMAAAGLTAAMGGSPRQIENAAEIAVEHCLGLTCDPIGGLVQVPCIERNGMGAVKAIAASDLALAGDGQFMISLDQVIDTVRETGKDMDSRYKETARGGLAIHGLKIPVTAVEC